jgi:hypothetical protein
MCDTGYIAGVVLVFASVFSSALAGWKGLYQFHVETIVST